MFIAQYRMDDLWVAFSVKAPTIDDAFTDARKLVGEGIGLCVTRVESIPKEDRGDWYSHRRILPR